ncbi:Sec1 family protein [Histomonas meleagridis]|uniref:Sec1 family protein n=1 Tax=Histomonas meleagridis TaxID=135588 RepID=UPI00355A12BA|nr:Sec1 family protein [Histomonas meleagridis]KAH0805791.1 Sec1 family protein [Histomonas meleagridis]
MAGAQKDTVFQTIIDQAIREFTTFGFPEGSICIIPENFQGRIKKLLTPTRMSRTFKQVLDISEAKGSNGSGTLVSILPNDHELVRDVCEAFKLYPKFKRTILIIPIYGRLSQLAVEESGIEKEITVSEFHADVITLESYEFLVPVPRCFKRVFVEHDIDDLTSISRALVKIEMLNGVFQKVHTFGPMSERVYHILQEMKEQISTNAFVEPPSFTHLIILDRTCDLYTPLMTQFTYEGILDENLHTDTGILKLPENVKIPDAEALPPTIDPKAMTITLNDNDGAFQEIRGMQLKDAVDKVSTEVSAIGKVKQTLRAGLDNNQFKAQKANAERLKLLKPLLTLHLDLMDYLVKMKSADPDFKTTIEFEYQAQMGIEIAPPLADKYMILDKNWDEAVRQYCISCLYQRGLNEKVLANFRRVMIERFGFQILDDLDNLVRANLVLAKIPAYKIFTAKLPTWEQTNKAFHVMTNPNDKDVFGTFYDGGYVPLLCRLVQSAVLGEMTRAKKNVMAKNNTPYTPPVEKRSFFRKSGIDKSTSQKVMIFVIGGIVPTEASIIRSMGLHLFQGAVEFYIGSTAILNGKDFVHEICPTIGKVAKEEMKKAQEQQQEKKK